jgi:uncharacterized protein (TIGR02611 family)
MASLLKRIKEDWRLLRDARPGERFQRLYRKRKSSEKSRLTRVAVLAVGVLIVLAGIVLLPVAGPGTLVILAGAALLARESRVAARALDNGEIRTRKLLGAILKFWRRAPFHIRAGVALGAVALLASTGFVVYMLVLRKMIESWFPSLV